MAKHEAEERYKAFISYSQRDTAEAGSKDLAGELSSAKGDCITWQEQSQTGPDLPRQDRPHRLTSNVACVTGKDWIVSQQVV
jgi:hypothetical protein